MSRSAQTTRRKPHKAGARVARRTGQTGYYPGRNRKQTGQLGGGLGGILDGAVAAINNLLDALSFIINDPLKSGGLIATGLVIGLAIS